MRSKHIVHAPTARQNTAATATENEELEIVATLVADVAIVEFLPVMATIAFVVFPDLFNDGRDIRSPFTLGDLLSSGEKPSLLPLQACACFPAFAANVAELSFAQAATFGQHAPSQRWRNRNTHVM